MKNIFQKIVFVLTLILPIYGYAQVQMNWQGGFGTGGTRVHWVSADIQGFSYMVGSGSGMDSPDLTYLAKYSPQGTPVFSFSIDTPFLPVNALFDSVNNIYVAGSYAGYWGPGNIVVDKYNKDGIRVWRHREPITSNNTNVIYLTSDRYWNLYLAYKYSNQNKIRKYNSNGNVILSFDINDTIDVSKVAVDHSGNIYIIGKQTIGFNHKAVIIKYNSNGIKIRKIFFIPENNGNAWYIRDHKIHGCYIYILIESNIPGRNADYNLVKYDSAGVLNWAAYYDRNNMYNYPYSITIDKNNKIYAAGSSGLVKYDTTGSVLWQDTTGDLRYVTTDKYSNVYVTGAQSSYISYGDMITRKLSPSGQNLWSIIFTGYYSNAADVGNYISLDTSLNVFVGGVKDFNPLIHGFGLLVKYHQLLGIQRSKGEIPTEFSLHQNYPNPFNPITKILFVIPAKAGIHDYLVRLIVYNSLGQKIETIVNQELSPGTYEVSFDGSKYPSGVYFYRLTTGDFTETKRMVLIK